MPANPTISQVPQARPAAASLAAAAARGAVASPVSSALAGGAGSAAAFPSLLAEQLASGNGLAAAARTKASAPSKQAGQALSWARSMLGRQDWNGLCEQFVEEAYGTKGVFRNATAAGQALATHRGKSSWHDAPAGSLLYFAPDPSNNGDGHAAIYEGNGKMISATPSGVREDRLDDPYWARLFLGWAEPDGLGGRGAAGGGARTGSAAGAAAPATAVAAPSTARTTRPASAFPPSLPGAGTIRSAPAPRPAAPPAASHHLAATSNAASSTSPVRAAAAYGAASRLPQTGMSPAAPLPVSAAPNVVAAVRPPLATAAAARPLAPLSSVPAARG
jgi:cell wall-associated NlpC family hydrolase